MLRGKYLQPLMEKAHVEIYLSGQDKARIYWPWRMLPPKVASVNYREACEKMIIDSDPLNDDVTNKAVLDKALELNADVASLQDIYLDKSGTVDSISRGLEIYDDHDFNGELLLPLQRPYGEAWKELGEPKSHMIGIGGLKDSNSKERLKAVKKLRETAGEDIWIHGFGWGVENMAREIRTRPALVDSIDYSSPVQGAIENNATNGDEISSVVAAQAGAKLIRDLREVSTYPNKEETKQTTLV